MQVSGLRVKEGKRDRRIEGGERTRERGREREREGGEIRTL